MINTILSGVLKMSFHVLDFFLSPIQRALDSAGLGAGLTQFSNAFQSLMNTLKGVLPWVIDATGLPKPIFAVIFATFLAGVGLRIAVFTLKLILKWWDRVVA